MINPSKKFKMFDIEHRNKLAQQRGFESYNQYQRYLYNKDKFKSVEEFLKYEKKSKKSKGLVELFKQRK